MLFGNRFENIFRLGALEQNSLAAGNQAAEPMHLCAGMIQRRNAQEYILLGLTVMMLLHAGCMHQRFMVVQNGLRESRRAGGEINRRIVLIGNVDERRLTRTVCRQMGVILRPARTSALAKIEHQAIASQLIGNRLQSADKMIAKHNCVDLCQLRTILDFIGIITEIERHRQRTGLENAKINRQPFQTVHQQNGNFIALFDAAAQQQIGKAVCLLVKHMPRNLSAVIRSRCRLHQIKFLPCYPSNLFDFRIQLNQCDIVAVQLAVFFK